MELKEEPLTPTLAQKLGDTTRVSPLLRKVCELSGLPEARVSEWFLKCAIERGAKHYVSGFSADVPPDSADLTDEELGVALCLGHHRYDTFLLRAAAQLLSPPETDAARLVLLAEMERVEPTLRHIAEVAAIYAPTLERGPTCAPIFVVGLRRRKVSSRTGRAGQLHRRHAFRWRPAHSMANPRVAAG